MLRNIVLMWIIMETVVFHRRRDRPDLSWRLRGETLESLVGAIARALQPDTRKLSLDRLRNYLEPKGYRIHNQGKLTFPPQVRAMKAAEITT